ncbi:hypothetical protein OA505_02165, partial [Alphaproteobacteria bacterium]|nr:hypothetical protein [Alphaproteobacteria bacterium]
LIPKKIKDKIKDKGKVKRNKVEKIQNLIKPISLNLFFSLTKFIICLQKGAKLVVNSTYYLIYV